MADLSSMLDKTATDHSEHPAIRQDDLVLTYAQLRESACRVASLLTSLGVTPGDRVGIMLPNVAAFPIAFYGALAAGATVVPMNPMLKNREIAYYLGDSGAKVLLAWHEAAVEAAKGAAGTGTQILEVDQPDMGALLTGITPASATADHAAEDDAVILYTSGTTGKPKGAELTHANLTRNAELAAATMLNAGPGDVTMGCLPLFHVFGLTCSLNATIATGGTLTLLPRFDAGQCLDIIGRDKVTIFEGVPTMYAAMLHHRAHASADTSSLRTCISGGASLPLEILRGFEQTFGCMILEAYGLSETSPLASFNHPDRVRKPGSIGTPLEGAYAASKHALEALSETLHFELGHFGIRVVIVEPGYIAPGMKHADDHEGPAGYADLHAQWGGTVATLTGPEGRPGPEVVGAAVADALEDPSTPLRVEVGKDAALVLQLRRSLGDVEFEATMREALGLTW